MAALAATLVAKTPMPTAIAHVVDVTGPTSYTTGGEAITTAILTTFIGAGRAIATILGCLVLDNGGGYGVQIDKTNSKLLFYNGTTQISNATDLSAKTVRILVMVAPANKGF